MGGGGAAVGLVASGLGFGCWDLGFVWDLGIGIWDFFSRGGGHGENDDFEGIEGAAEIAVAEDGEIGEEGVGSAHVVRAEAASGVGEGAAQDAGDGGGGKRFEAEEVAAAEEGRVDVETGVVRGGPDEADVTFLDIGEE